MTCIVGIQTKDGVVFASDSIGSNGYNRVVRKDKKIFVKGPYLIGYTSSFRMGQILQYSLEVPKQDCVNDHEHMATTFVDSCRKLFAEKGYGEHQAGKDNTGGSFIVGYKGMLYVVEEDYQVGVPSSGYAAVGSGRDVAIGSLFSTRGNAKSRAVLAVKAAISNVLSCGGPVRVMEQFRK